MLISVLLLSLLSATALAQVVIPDPDRTPHRKQTTTSISNGADASTATGITTDTTTSSAGSLQTTANAGVGGGSQHTSEEGTNAFITSGQSQSPSNTVSSTRSTASATQSVQSPTASPSPQQSITKSGGLTSQEKMGIGIGVGVGVPILAGAIALFFLLGRRTRNKYGSERSAEQYRDQPGMASGAPALAGMSEMGRSPSKHSLPRTPSQHSLVEFPSAAPEPKIMPPSQHSFTIERAPTQYSVTPSLPEQQSFMSPPPAYEYDDAPSPMEEHPDPVSPVSPVSSMGSRPPSFINDHHHDR